MLHGRRYMSENADVTIIGGGIVGLATGLALVKNNKVRVGRLIILEAEDQLAAHQTGHNSGVIHSGLYYKPASLKATNCVQGRDAMYRFCKDHGIAHEQCGKLVVASCEEELPALEQLEKRGRQNGLEGIRRLKGAEAKEYEPNVECKQALFVPQTGIVDYSEVCLKMAGLIESYEGSVYRQRRVVGYSKDGMGHVLNTQKGDVKTRLLINCAGLQSDRVARMCGIEPRLKIVPFRGEYYELHDESRALVRNLVYPVPDSRFPFLGVHFTRMIAGGLEAGPNAVLAFKREGYGRINFSLRDCASWLFYSGFWRMAIKFWRMGFAEMWRSWSKRSFLRSMRKLVPLVKKDGIRRGGCGIRAQAVLPDGRLVDDFRIEMAPGQIHVLNAPSPAATASLAIGRHIADMAIEQLGAAF